MHLKSPCIALLLLFLPTVAITQDDTRPPIAIGPIDVQPLVEGLRQVENAVRGLTDTPYPVEEADALDRDVRDVAAQEAMAEWARWMFWATMGGVGLGLLSLAAIVVTLLYTRRAALSAEVMAEDARAIGRAQVRAYLHCHKAEYQLGEGYIGVGVHLENTGQSPASAILVTGSVTINEICGLASMPRVHRSLVSMVEQTIFEPIAAQGSGTGEMTFFWSDNFPEEEHHDRRFQKEVFERGNQVWFDLAVS